MVGRGRGRTTGASRGCSSPTGRSWTWRGRTAGGGSSWAWRIERRVPGRLRPPARQERVLLRFRGGDTGGAGGGRGEDGDALSGAHGPGRAVRHPPLPGGRGRERASPPSSGRRSRRRAGTSCCWPRGWKGTVRCAGSSRLTGALRRTGARPSCPLATMLEHAGGLVCLTGAVPFGLLPRLVLPDEGKATEVLRPPAGGVRGPALRGADGRRDGAGRRRHRERWRRSRGSSGVPVLATNEVAYLCPTDHGCTRSWWRPRNLTACRVPSTGLRTSLPQAPGRDAPALRGLPGGAGERRREWRSGARGRWTCRAGCTCRRRSCRRASRRGRMF